MSRAGSRPPRRYLAALFLVSAAMLGFEVLLLRLFEFSHWHHFAGLAVSLALLGLGTAGTCLTLLAGRPAGRGDGLLITGVAIQAAGTLAVVLLHASIAVRPLFAFGDVGELARLLLVDFAAFVPFFGAGLVIGCIFMRWPGAAAPIYAANLLGAGAGSIAASALLSALAVERVLALAALLPVLALLALGVRRPARAAGAVMLGAVVAATVAWPPPPAVSDFKALSRVMDLPDARQLAVEPGLHGRLTLVRSDSLRNAPGLSLQWTRPVPPSDAVVIGSDRMVPLPRAFPADAAHMQASLAGLPFRLRPRGAALVLGASEWQSPLAAGDRPLTWIEPDGRILELARARGLGGPHTTLASDGAYRYLATAAGRFEVAALDAAFAGGDAASEDYLLTAQGLGAALSRLAPGGLLAVPLELAVPPRHFPRALATLRAALDRAGVAQPARHVAALRGLQAALILASPQPLTGADRAAIRGFADEQRFDLVWLPGLAERDANRYHRLASPMFHRAARAVLAGGPVPEPVRWFERVAADTDRPYFWRSLVWERIPDFLRSMSGRQALSYLDWTLILSALSAALATGLAFLLILAPLGRLPPARGRPGRAAVAAYFAALGVGYMLLELALLQRSILFLGEPVTAAALVFAVFLIGSGLGSAATPARADRRAAARVFGAIAGGVVLGVVVLWPLADAVLALPRAARLGVLALAILPGAWALGRAFPWALQQLAQRGHWVPWAWAINGFASVVAASLATLVSVQWGQSTTLALAALCYAAAGLVARGWAAAVSGARAPAPTGNARG